MTARSVDDIYHLGGWRSAAAVALVSVLSGVEGMLRILPPAFWNFPSSASEGRPGAGPSRRAAIGACRELRPGTGCRRPSAGPLRRGPGLRRPGFPARAAPSAAPRPGPTSRAAPESGEARGRAPARPRAPPPAPGGTWPAPQTPSPASHRGRRRSSPACARSRRTVPLRRSTPTIGPPDAWSAAPSRRRARLKTAPPHDSPPHPAGRLLQPPGSRARLVGVR